MMRSLLMLHIVAFVPHAVCEEACEDSCAASFSSAVGNSLIQRTREALSQRQLSGNCRDNVNSCKQWASMGECGKNPAYMNVNCKLSCTQCSEGSTGGEQNCQDANPSCGAWAAKGECGRNPKYMNANCKRSCNQCSAGSTGSQQNCKDNNPSCGAWAGRGECSRNPGYMSENCRLSCQQCSSGGGSISSGSSSGGGTSSSSSNSEFVRGLNLPKQCSGQTQFIYPFHWGTITLKNIIKSSDPTTYSGDLTDAGRGVDNWAHQWWDSRTDTWQTFSSNPLRFTCTFRYSRRAYQLLVRANPNDWSSHSQVRQFITPYLEALGRIPEIMWTNLKTLTVNGPGQRGNMAAGNGDIAMNHQCCEMDRLGETFLHEGTHISVQQTTSWSAYSQLIRQDCNEFYSKYAKDHQEREGVAESFVAYFALRFRRERLTQQEITDIMRVGPNRLKFFYENVNEAMSKPPARSVSLMSTPGGDDEDVELRSLPDPDSAPTHRLTEEELRKLAAEYMAESEYLRGIGITNNTDVDRE